MSCSAVNLPNFRPVRLCLWVGLEQPHVTVRPASRWALRTLMRFAQLQMHHHICSPCFVLSPLSHSATSIPNRRPVMSMCFPNGASNRFEQHRLSPHGVHQRRHGLQMIRPAAQTDAA